MLAGDERIKKGKAGGFVSAVAIGLAVTAALMLGASMLLSSGKIGVSAANEIVTGINFIGAAAAGVIASSKKGRGAIPIGLGVGAVYMAVLMLAGVAFSKGSLAGAEAVRIAVCSLCGGLFGGVLGMASGNKKLHKKHGSKR